MNKIIIANTIERHPCFNKAAHHKYVRLHLPVAPECNISCNYCVRGFDCVNESRPGVTSRVVTPGQALETVTSLTARDGRISVIGIAGPGEPLANGNTLKAVQLIKREFPDLSMCLSTNGLLLKHRLGDLLEAGVESVTVTINAVTAQTASRVYAWIRHEGELLRGLEAAQLLNASQWEGAGMAVESGLAVKINTVYIPGVNDGEIEEIAKRAAQIDAHIMNIMPLIPQAAFKDIVRPTEAMVAAMRLACSVHIEQMWHCKQCRADAFGTLTEDKDVELEMVYSQISSDYCEMVF